MSLDQIRTVLESDAGLLIEDTSQPVHRKLVDNRFALIQKYIHLIEKKDDNFYSELIKLMGMYIDQLYDKKVEDFPSIVLDEKGNRIPQDYDELNVSDLFHLKKANRELSEKLFEYGCDILESNRNIQLNMDTLRNLLNRHLHSFHLSIEQCYLYRTFNYKKLVEIISKNQIIAKSNISIDEIYQLLLNTYQLNNEDVFPGLLKPEQFHQNHQRIDEILTWCNAEFFVEVTNIIRCHFDNKFDRFSIVKKRNQKHFCEEVIIKLLQWCPSEDDYAFIHQILTDSKIKIDYDLYSANCIGRTDLKSVIALSENKTIIKDLLSQEQNIQNRYWHEDHCIQLYILYAIIGDYEKALINFEEKYNFKDDLSEGNNKWDENGYAYGNWEYRDSLARFIGSLCASFKENCVDYAMIVNILNRVINSKNVTYMNLRKTLPPIQEVLSTDDFKQLTDNLLQKQNIGNLGFLTVHDHDEGTDYRYIIGIASEEETQSYLSSLYKKKKLEF